MFFFLPQPLCKGTSENRLWVSSFYLYNGKRIWALCILVPLLLSLRIGLHPLVSLSSACRSALFCFCFVSPLCACSCACATARQPGLIKPDKQSWPQYIASAPDGLHTFKYDGKWCRFDFNCLRPTRITGTDTPLVHFCNSVLFPGWCWSCHSGCERAESLFSCLFTVGSFVRFSLSSDIWNDIRGTWKSALPAGQKRRTLVTFNLMP